MAAIAFHLSLFTFHLSAATGVLEDLPNTAPVVTNEEDAVAMAAVGALGQAMSNRVEAAENSLQAEIAGATNAVVQAAISAAEAESNRVDATFAKRSEIPAAQDLTPYALKSELPTDYLRENDITNFATRSWISAQGYASGAEIATRIDAQDNAIAAATNAQNAAISAASNALATAHAADVAAIRASASVASNALATAHAADVAALRASAAAASNALATAHAADMTSLRAATNAIVASVSELRSDTNARIDALELTGGMTRLWSSDATTWQDATGVVWQVQVATSLWTVVHSWTTNDLGWDGPWWWGPEGAGEEYYEGSGWYISSSSLTPWLRSEDPYASEIKVEWEYWGDETHVVTTRCTRTVQWLTNAVNRVAYTNDVAAAIVRLENEGTVRNAERLVDTMTGDSVTVVDVQQIAQAGTNYTDAVAAEFEDGTRQVQHAMSAGSASDAMFAYKVSGDEWYDQYNANDLMRASTNAAKAVVAPAAVAATNYTDAATNALAQTIGGGGGMPEWREVNYDVEIDTVNYVTNGIASLTFIDAGYAYSLIVSTNGWPEGAAMFVRGSLRAGATYTVPNELRLIGYGTWPTNDFQSVWWRSGTNIFVNVLIEE